MESYILNYSYGVPVANNLLNTDPESMENTEHKTEREQEDNKDNAKYLSLKHIDIEPVGRKKQEKVECPTCGKIFSGGKNYASKNYADHKKIHKSIDCPHCGKTLSMSTNINLHLQRCKKNPNRSCSMYQCTECDYETPIKSDLTTKHYKLVHSEAAVEKRRRKTRKFKCEFCDLKFWSERKYLRHYKTHVPKKKKTFKCNKCDGEFGGLQALTKHLKTHEISLPRERQEIRYHKCHICDYKSNKKFNLSTHVWRVHERKVDKRPKPKIFPKCSFCDYTSQSRYVVSRHEGTCPFSGPEIFCIV